MDAFGRAAEHAQKKGTRKLHDRIDAGTAKIAYSFPRKYIKQYLSPVDNNKKTSMYLPWNERKHDQFIQKQSRKSSRCSENITHIWLFKLRCYLSGICSIHIGSLILRFQKLLLLNVCTYFDYQLLLSSYQHAGSNKRGCLFWPVICIAKTSYIGKYSS